MKIIWTFPRNRHAATLYFPTETAKELLETLLSEIKLAGFDGHVIVFTASMSEEKKSIFMMKWNHFSWEQAKEAIEHTIRQHIPLVVFEEGAPPV